MKKKTGKRVGNPTWRKKPRPTTATYLTRQRIADAIKVLVIELQRHDFLRNGSASPDARARFTRVVGMSARLEIAIDEWVRT